MDLFTQRNTAFYYHVDSFQGKPVDAYINFIIPFVSLKAILVPVFSPARTKICFALVTRV